MVEHKLKKIGEILDHIETKNIGKLKHFSSELDKKHKLLDKKHEKLMQKHKHLSKRDGGIKQRHSNLKLKEKEYKKVLNLKKGLDRKSKKLAQLHKDIKDKRANLKDRIFQEKIKIEQRYLEKENQLNQFMQKLEDKDKQLNKEIINLECDKIKLMQSLSKKKKKQKLIPASAVDLWPMHIGIGLQQKESEQHKQILKDLPNIEFIREMKKHNVKII